MPTANRGSASMDNVMDFPVRLLNQGNTAAMIPAAITSERRLVSTASPMNWLMSIFRCAPITLRRPTSRARFAEREVARFMKLITAISRMSNAMNEKRYTCWMLPFVSNSSSMFDVRWTSLAFWMFSTTPLSVRLAG